LLQLQLEPAMSTAPHPMIVYVNGEYLPQGDAKISVFDRGFLFADGIYEVSAIFNGQLVDNDAHLARLERSVGEIKLKMPWSRAEITAIQNEVILRNGVSEGLIYLQVTRGSAPVRDFKFPDQVTPSLIMFAKSANMSESAEAATGIRVKTVPDIRWMRRDIKSVALLAQVLAKQEAAEAGCQEAWMVEDGMVTEGGSSTAWIIDKDGTLVTRGNSQKILPGITRKAVEALLGDGKIKFDIRAFSVAEALEAQEAWVTAASSLVMPVVEIDGQKIGTGKPGPFATKLRQTYIAMARQGGRLG
jgi:D-alanine transaminase